MSRIVEDPEDEIEEGEEQDVEKDELESLPPQGTVLAPEPSATKKKDFVSRQMGNLGDKALVCIVNL